MTANGSAEIRRLLLHAESSRCEPPSDRGYSPLLLPVLLPAGVPALPLDDLGTLDPAGQKAERCQRLEGLLIIPIAIAVFHEVTDPQSSSCWSASYRIQPASPRGLPGPGYAA